MRKIKVNEDFCYYISGDDPKLLIHTGTHGDEWEVIGLVESYLRNNEKRLPDFLYVPEVSPSAVAKGTRNNWANRDMNRSFYAHLDDPEVLANIKILKNRKFDLMISFHEDHEFENEYYVYDVGRDGKENKLVLSHNQLLKERGICLMNRVDSPDDPDLGYLFVDGYKKFEHKDNLDHGIAGWILDTKIAEEYLMPEIPMKAKIETKKMIVDTFFEEVVLKMLR